MSEEDMEVETGERPGWILPVTGLVVIAAIAAWFWLRDPKPAPVPATAATAEVAPTEDSVTHPLDGAADAATDAPVPLPALADSDAPLIAEFAALTSAEAVSSWLVPESIVRARVKSTARSPATAPATATSGRSSCSSRAFRTTTGASAWAIATGRSAARTCRPAPRRA